MAVASTPSMAASVSNAGGLGSIAIGALTVTDAANMIRETQQRTEAAFNVNVFCHPPATRNLAAEAQWIAHLTPSFHELGATPPARLSEIYKSFLENSEALAMLLELRPPVVSFHFGLPLPDHIRALHEAGIATFATATNLAEAHQIERAGISAVVAQGFEAGGHRGQFDLAAHDPQLSTCVLIRLLARQVSLPIIATGGIMDRPGVIAALEAGASAVQMGTAFLLCPESAADDAYRAALKSMAAHDTRFTSAISGRPARGIANRLHELGAVGPKAPCYPVAYDIGKQLNAAARVRGDSSYAAHWAGQGAPLAREAPAATLVMELSDGSV